MLFCCQLVEKRVLPYSWLYRNASTVLSLRMKFTAAHWETYFFKPEPSPSIVVKGLPLSWLGRGIPLYEWKFPLQKENVPCLQSSGCFSAALISKESMCQSSIFWSGLIWNPSVLCPWHRLEFGWDFSGIWINHCISRICFLDLFDC